jgi:uncharacterized protein with NAD-binding domain and iron-sulfur cluster
VSADVVVIGGGVAGFSAATALADAGARVLVLEARPGLGGRATAFTDPTTGERVDNGQHILMGCYTETLRLLERIGASARVRWQAGLALTMIDQRGHESVLKLPPMPSPVHLLGGVLAWDALSWTERLSILRVGAALGPPNHLRQGYGGQEGGHHIGTGHIGTAPMWRPALAGPEITASAETVRDWLTRHGQAPRLCELFWEPLALAALNQSIDQAAAPYFVTVLTQMFGPDPVAASLVIPAVPLDELYAEPARAWLQHRGHDVRVNAPARVAIAGDRVTGVSVRGEHIPAPVVISTVPWHGLAGLFETPPPALASTIANASATPSLPIVTVNLWFDRPVMHESLIGLPGRAFQWVFDRRAIVGGTGSHLSMIASGAESMVSMTNDALIATALADVRAALPAARTATVRNGLAVREKRSTFSIAPDAPPRPPTETAVTGFLLAGDWVDTGLPATIESAAVSGHRAARVATRSF